MKAVAILETDSDDLHGDAVVEIHTMTPDPKYFAKLGVPVSPLPATGFNGRKKKLTHILLWALSTMTISWQVPETRLQSLSR